MVTYQQQQQRTPSWSEGPPGPAVPQPLPLAGLSPADARTPRVWASTEQILYWQRQVDHTARDRGWFDHPRSVPEDLVMLHDEISELLEQLEQGVPWLWWRPTPSGGQPTPDGPSMEVADLAIRALGVAHVRQVDWTPWLLQARLQTPDPTPGSPPFLLRLHRRVSLLCRHWRDGQELNQGEMPGQQLACLWVDLERWCQQQGTPLLWLVQLKDRHNRTRPRRHGGKRI